MVVDGKVEVLEVDQFTAVGNVAGTHIDDWRSDTAEMLRTREGEVAVEARKIFGGDACLRTVSENAWPSIGRVWFRPDASGILRWWRHTPDTSD